MPISFSTVAESVEVVATSTPLQTDRADMVTTQTTLQMTNLPLTGGLGRNYQSLMQVVLGASIVRSETGRVKRTPWPAVRSARFR